jgi:hypothetical protein
MVRYFWGAEREEAHRRLAAHNDSARPKVEALLQKRFVVSAVKSFFVSVSPADTILRIQKIDYFSYRLFPADTQNRFSKIKKIGA